MKRITGALLALMMVLSSFVSAIPMPALTVESAGEPTAEFSVVQEAEVEENSVSMSVQAEADDRFASHPRYGANLINLDFETEYMNPSAMVSATLTESGTEEQFKFIPLHSYISNLGAVNPQYADRMNDSIIIHMESSKNCIYTIKNNTTATQGIILVTDEKTGNTYGEFPVGGQWPNIELRAYDSTKALFDTNGYFTFSGDFLINSDTDGDSTTNDSICLWSKYHLLRDGTTNVDIVQYGVHDYNVTTNKVYGKWNTMTRLAKQVGNQSYKIGGVAYTGDVQNIFAAKYGATVTKQDSYDYSIYLDNLKLYYKPFTANLTIDMNGNTVATPIAGLTDYDTETLVDISAIEDRVVDHGDKIFVGFSFTPNGEIITQDFYLTENTTIYAIWESYAKGLYSNEMDSATGISFVKGVNSAAEAGKAVTTEGDTTFMRYTYVAENKYKSIVDSTFDMNGLISNKMPTSDIKALQMRVRISNLPDFKELFPVAVVDSEGKVIAPAATSSTYYKDGGGKVINHKEEDFYIYMYTDAPLSDGSAQTGLSESRKIKLPAYDYSVGSARYETWATYYFDLENDCIDSGGVNYWQNSEVVKQMRFDFPNYLWDGTVIDVDFVHFIEKDADELIEPKCDIYLLNGGVKTPVTGNMTNLDYRKNSVLCFDFDRDTGLTAEEFRAKLTAGGSASDLFDAACEYDSENFVYTLYEESLLRGKTFNLGKFSLAYEIDGKTARFEKKYNNLSLSYASYTAFDDGENLVPNGNFDVPYYNPFNKSGRFVQEIKDGSLYVTHTDSAAEWSSNTTEAISLKENTHYYISMDVDHVAAEGKEYPVTDEKVGLSLTLYFPRADSFFNYGDDSKSIDNDEIKYIPSLTSAGNWSLSGENLGNEQSEHSRIMSVRDDAYYSVMVRKENSTKWHYGNSVAASFEELQKLYPDVTLATDRWFGHGLWSSTYKDTFFTHPTITLQTCFSDGLGKGLTKESTGITGASGVAYKVDTFIIKEMFDISFVYEDGTQASDARLAAKDVEMMLPVIYDEIGNRYFWKDSSGKLYDPNESFVLITAGDMTLTAVSISDKAPTNEEKTSVRTSGYTGIRFLASIDSALKEQTTEYGFIVTRKTILDNAGLKAEQLTFENKDKVAFMSKASYAEGGDDYIYATDGDTIFFTGLMVGIPEENLSDVLVVRPYSKVNGIYVYGKPSTDSVLSVAKRAYANGYKDADGNALSEQTVEYLKYVLEIFGENSEAGAIMNLTAEEKYKPMRVSADYAKAEIVTDPTNPDNKVYKLTPAANKKGDYSHIMSIDKMEYVLGATYEVTADVMVITDEGAYKTQNGEKIENITVNVDANGDVYTVYDDNTKSYQTGRGILYTTTHEPMGAKRLKANSFTTVTTSAVCANAITNGGFGFITDLVSVEYENEKTGVRLPVYIDNITIRKTADPAPTESTEE